ncbi:MAG: DUF3079 domain-containing protein [Myxococcota bacterium]
MIPRADESTRFPLRPKHPERVCWGCERYCSANDMACQKERSLHPIEIIGETCANNADDNENKDGSSVTKSVLIATSH